MAYGQENLSAYARKIDYFREYYSRPEVKKRMRRYTKKYFKTPKGRQILRESVRKYNQNNKEYLAFIKFIRSRQEKLRRIKNNYNLYYRRKQNMYAVKALEHEIAVYQRYLDEYRRFRKELIAIKDLEVRKDREKFFLINLLDRMDNELIFGSD